MNAYEHTNIKARTIPAVHTVTWSKSQQTTAGTMRLASPRHQYWWLPTAITAFSIYKEQKTFLSLKQILQAHMCACDTHKHACARSVPLQFTSRAWISMFPPNIHLVIKRRSIPTVKFLLDNLTSFSLGYLLQTVVKQSNIKNREGETGK
jgi:hypothetical protein